jgi:hypothetical protein
MPTSAASEEEQTLDRRFAGKLSRSGLAWGECEFSRGACVAESISETETSPVLAADNGPTIIRYA